VEWELRIDTASSVTGTLDAPQSEARLDARVPRDADTLTITARRIDDRPCGTVFIWTDPRIIGTPWQPSVGGACLSRSPSSAHWTPSLTIGQTGGMTVKVGISLPDTTHTRAVELARTTGTTLSGLVDAALRAELTRRDATDHVAMLAQADDPDRLRQRARRRSEALAGWKAGR